MDKIEEIKQAIERRIKNLVEDLSRSADYGPIPHEWRSLIISSLDSLLENHNKHVTPPVGTEKYSENFGDVLALIDKHRQVLLPTTSNDPAVIDDVSSDRSRKADLIRSIADRTECSEATVRRALDLYSRFAEYKHAGGAPLDPLNRREMEVFEWLLLTSSPDYEEFMKIKPNEKVEHRSEEEKRILARNKLKS